MSSSRWPLVVSRWPGRDEAARVAQKPTTNGLTTALFQLLLPSQHPCLGAFGFRFWNHALLLVKNGQAGVGQYVFGIDFGDALGHRDRFIQAAEILQRPGQAV